jgi:hypothetical protein
MWYYRYVHRQNFFTLGQRDFQEQLWSMKLVNCLISLFSYFINVSCVCFHHDVLFSQVSYGGDGPLIWRIVANVWNKKSLAAVKGLPFRLGVGRESVIPRCKIIEHITKWYTEPYAGSYEHDNELSVSVKAEKFWTSWAKARLSIMTILCGVGYFIHCI